MKLVGFNFNKIHADKTPKQESNLKISTNIDISDIGEVKSDFFQSTNEIMLGVTFEYSINYEPDFAKISFSGIVLVSLPQKEAKSILDSWKDKKIPESFKLTIFNLILKKATVKALQLEEELNLPSHIQTPYIKPGAKNTDNSKTSE